MVGTEDDIFVLEVAVTEKVLAESEFFGVFLHTLLELDIFGLHLAVLHDFQKFDVVLSEDTYEVILFHTVKNLSLVYFLIENKLHYIKGKDA